MSNKSVFTVEHMVPELAAMMLRLESCAFTGHRPQKLPRSITREEIKLRLSAAIAQAADEGIRHFISGAGLGIDTWAAQAVVELRKSDRRITLELALPCVSQDKLWSASDKEIYAKLLESADKLSYISDGEYENGCMQKRNRYLVDRCSLLIAAYSGEPGGTKYTMDYAEKNGIKIVNILQNI